ncbi:MAG: CGNR zinc finger domain-containing protein [Actinobacteria bacterium]|nr:CGNR zinc finger domain-containing protein [Actinomycetota bacterium]
MNTNDIEAAADIFATPESLAEWLRDHGLIGDEAVSAADHERALVVREGLRELAAVNNEGEGDPGAIAGLNRVARNLPLLAGFGGPKRWELSPGAPGVPGALGSILAQVLASMDDGTWSRVKTCRRDSCRWVFYDHSRNRSGTWCSMAVCGNRTKAETYRRRHSADHEPESG